MSIGDLAGVFNVHPNTVRSDLKHLLALEMVEAIKDDNHEHGRPRTLFQAKCRDDLMPGKNYPSLSSRLLSWINQQNQSPPSRSLYIWGKKLGRQAAINACCFDDEITALTYIGFDPQMNGSVIDLGKCPYNGEASEYRDIVCNLDVGFVQSYMSNLWPKQNFKMKVRSDQGCQIMVSPRN